MRNAQDAPDRLPIETNATPIGAPNKNPAVTVKIVPGIIRIVAAVYAAI